MRIPRAEWTRKAIHAGMGLFALALRWLDWRQAAALALAALLFNVFVMPRVGRGIYRNAAKKWDTGIVAYAAMVLVLVLLFRGQYLPIAAAVWAMMAFGDPAAALVGRLAGGARLPWNGEKTWAGALGNWAAGSLGAVLVFWFVSARRLEPIAVAILVVGAALYAFLESVRAGMDDNLVAALPTAFVLLQLGHAWSAPMPPWPAWSVGTGLAALAVNGAVAILTWKMGLVSGSGAIAGGFAGFLVVALGGWGAYAVLWAFFLVGTAATKLGYARKAQEGVAEANRGRRGAAHVIANVGVPVALLVVGARPVAFVAAFAAALADTLGTEVGTLYGRRPFSPLRLARTSAGTAGAVSWPGLAAGLLGAGLIGSVAAGLKILSPTDIAVVAAAGLIGSLAESFAHDLGRARGMRLDHDFANAFNTLVGALVALEIVLSIEARSVFLPVAGA